MNMTSIVKYVLVLCVLFVAGYTNAQITINTNFSVLSNQPIDSRDTLTTLADTSSVTWTFPGLLSYVVDIDEFWYYTGTQWRKLFDGTTIPSTVPDSLIVYAPAHGLSDTIALYGYVPVKADFTRANSTSIDSVFIAYAIDAPDTDSLTLIFSGVLTYGSWHGKELNTQYYLQDDGSDDTTPGTVSVPTAIASDSLTLFLREVGSDIAGQLRRVAMPSPLITAFGGNPASPTDAVVQAAIEGTYLPAGLAQPGTVFTLSYATQSYNPTYQQTAPNTNPLTPSYAWLWDGAYATRIVNIPTSVNLQDTSYGVLGTLVLLPIDSLMAASVPTDTEVALWLDTNYTANNLRLANGSLLYFLGDSTRQNPEYIWQVIDDISFDAGDTDWEKILKRIKSPVVAADGDGIYSGSGTVPASTWVEQLGSLIFDIDSIGSFTVGDIDEKSTGAYISISNTGGNDGAIVMKSGSGKGTTDDTIELNNYYLPGTTPSGEGLPAGDYFWIVSEGGVRKGEDSTGWIHIDSLLNGYTTGAGTSGTIPIWNGTASLGNSSLTEASGVLSSSLTGALKLPAGTDAQDPVWSAGMLRYNTTTGGFQGYNTAERYLVWGNLDNFNSGRVPYSNGNELTSSSAFTFSAGTLVVGTAVESPVFQSGTAGGNVEFRGKAANGAGNGGIAILRGGQGALTSYSGGNCDIRNGPVGIAAAGGDFSGVPGDITIRLYPDTTAAGAFPASRTMLRFHGAKLRITMPNRAQTTTGIQTLTMESDTIKYRVENLGNISTSTDGSGDIVVAHGMGVTPTVVDIQFTGTSGSATPYVYVVLTDGTDATNFTIRVFDMTGAAVTSTAVTATWHCKT